MSLLCSLVFLAAWAAAEPALIEPIEPVEPTSVVPPQVILSTQKPPIYPPAALAARFDGVVHLRVNVQPDGRVGRVAVVDCDHPNLGFEDASLDAVRQWRFEPALRGDVPVEYETTLRLSFRTGSRSGERAPFVSAGQLANPDDHAQSSTAELAVASAPK